MRAILAILVLVLLLLPGSFLAQSPYASVVGIVFDPDSKTIPGAEIIVVNDVTRVQYQTKTNNDGIYAVANLPPGPYRMQVSKVGFKTIIKPDIVLNVQDSLSVNFTLPIGATSVTVMVEGGAPLINTTDGSISTVVDRNFVEHMPLNGRSFQDLILLTPGVVTNSPQSTSSVGTGGEFSVNGQRTESNYYSVDGVSANVGVSPGFPAAPSISGSLPSATALGTTQALVPLDALQEFRVQSSTYSAEYGRNPGGQFSFATRSGTNQWHGTVFEYLRNNAFDANDWFTDYFRVPQAALRQNDFGGTLGGPIGIPHVSKGRNQTFAFFSYEGVRLVQPQEATVSYVPTSSLRSSAPSGLQPVLSSFPMPYCSSSGTNCTTDLGNGLGEFVGTWSNPSSIDSYSVRLDHVVSQSLRLFFRFSDAPSRVLGRGDSANFSAPSFKSETSFLTRSYTFGATSTLWSHFNNDFRLNFTSNSSSFATTTDGFGGATAVDLIQLQGVNTRTYPSATVYACFFLSAFGSCASQGTVSGRQEQWNIVDGAGISRGRHQFKLGVDYRRLMPRQDPANPYLAYDYFSESSVLSNSVDYGFALSNVHAYPVYLNTSLFVQDDWNMTRRLSLSMGLRWEVNPAPGAERGNLPYTITGNVASPDTLALAAQGTPLWPTTWHNFAPRVGGAFVVADRPGFETVVRGGFGVFYDTGQQEGSVGYEGPGFAARVPFGSGASFPVAASQATPQIGNPPAPPYSTVYSFSPDFQLPFTFQWNATVTQSLGRSQALTISYVGANGRRLLAQREFNVASGNPNFSSVVVFGNGLSSDYNAAQVQLQRKLNRGLQALASYTWSHSIDFGSFNAAFPYERGNSDLDVRHSFSAALSGDVPNISKNKFAGSVLHHWGLDGRLAARTGFPVTLNGNYVVDPATGQISNSGLDLVSGQPLYISGAQFPGGRAINPAAFTLPPVNQFGTAPRNLVRGFGALQLDLAIRREFPIYERLKVQFRAEAFNILNHPNFGAINATYCAGGVGCTFGQATSTLAESLGVLSPLYQMGGPRSIQLSLKLAF